MWLKKMFSSISLDDMPEADANVAFFVSKYIAHSISCQQICSFCKKILMKHIYNPTMPIQISVPNDNKELFKMADRGGLTKPTEVCFAIMALAMQCYTKVASDES